MRETLDQIAVACGADKSSLCHNYTAAYEPWFAPLRDQPITLLEIGVGGGHSLRMWQRYFSAARIIGVEINREAALAGLRVIYGDATNPGVILAACSAALHRRFDVVIDDGSHRWADQDRSFALLWPLLALGGQYWIEDLHTSYWPSHGDATYRPTMEILKSLADDVQMRGKPPEGPDCRADRGAVLDWAATPMERTVAEVHFWKGLALVVKQCS